MTGRIILIGSLIQGVLCGFSITQPNNLEVLSGSCAFIPCTFDIDPEYNNDLTANARRLWYKDGISHQKVFDSRSPSSGVLNGTIFGNAMDKNCTTRFHYFTQNNIGRYHFRLEGNNKLKYNYATLQMNVRDSPPKPKVSIYKQQHQEVVEGTSVILTCSVKMFCSSHPPALIWSTSTIVSIREQQRQIQSNLISDLHFTATHQHHRVSFTCMISYQLQNRNTSAQESMTLHVQYAPKNTSVFVSPSGCVLEGHSVSLTCSSDGNPAVINFTWHRDTEGHLEHLQTGPDLSFNKTEPQHSGRYYCTAHNKHGNQTSTTLMLDVQLFFSTVGLVQPTKSQSKSVEVSLTCSSDGNPAVINFTWHRDTEGHLEHLQTGPDLSFNKTEPQHSGRYYCTAHNKHGNQISDTIILNITYAPKISQSSCSKSHIITCFCEVDGNPVPTLEWRLSGRPVVNSTTTSIFQEQLGDTKFRTTLTVNQPLTDTPTLQCVSGNSHGSASQQFQELQPPPSCFDGLSLLAGVVIGVIVMLIVGIVSLFCMRRQNDKPSQTEHEDSTGPAAVLDNDCDVYVNKSMFSSTEAVTHHTSESLHYSSINFINTEAASGEKRDISLTTDYSEVQHHAADATRGEKHLSRCQNKSMHTRHDDKEHRRHNI